MAGKVDRAERPWQEDSANALSSEKSVVARGKRCKSVEFVRTVSYVFGAIVPLSA